MIWPKTPQEPGWWPTPNTFLIFPLTEPWFCSCWQCASKFISLVFLELLLVMWLSSGRYDARGSPWGGWPFRNKKKTHKTSLFALPASSCVRCGCNAWRCSNSFVTMRTKVRCWRKSCTSPGLPSPEPLGSWIKEISYFFKSPVVLCDLPLMTYLDSKQRNMLLLQKSE